MRYAGLFVVSLCAITLLSASASAGDDPSAAKTSMNAQTSWTLMVYMAADVGDELPWLQDINEMEAAFQTDETNIIVLLDPPDDGDTRLLEIAHDDEFFNPVIVSSDIEDNEEVVPVSGEVNTGSSDTLQNFIEFTSANYPADNLVLVLWGHGAGWRGLCPDGYDLLTLPELRAAIAAAADSLPDGLDMIVLDICNGATMELALETQEYADILVGSELGVPAEGLPYTEVLNALHVSPNQSLAEFGSTIVDEYVDWATYGSSYPVSASVLDLETVGVVSDSLNQISQLGVRFDRLFHDDLVTAVDLSEHSEGDEWLIDFGTLNEELTAEALPLELRMEALTAGTLSLNAVLDHGQFSPDGTDTGTTGMSLYVPDDSHEDEGYADLRIAAITAWSDLANLLREDRTSNESGPGPSVTTSDSPSDDDELPDAATVSWDVSEEWNYTWFSVHVFRIEPGGYTDCGVIESVSSEIHVLDAIGRLVLSATACRDDQALAHHSIDVTLSSMLTVSVSLPDIGVLEGEGVEIAIVPSASAPMVVECSGDSCEAEIAVPDWADIGELLTIQVLAADDWEVLSEKTVVVSDQDMSVTMPTFAPQAEAETRPIVAYLLASVVAVLGTATVVLVNFVLRNRGRPRV